MNINHPNQYIFSICTYITVPKVHFWGYSECTYFPLISRDFANKVISDKVFENFIRVCPTESCWSVSKIRFLAQTRALYSIISSRRPFLFFLTLLLQITVIKLLSAGRDWYLASIPARMGMLAFLFLLIFPALRSQTIPPLEDNNDLWALVSGMPPIVWIHFILTRYSWFLLEIAISKCKA